MLLSVAAFFPDLVCFLAWNPLERVAGLYVMVENHPKKIYQYFCDGAFVINVRKVGSDLFVTKNERSIEESAHRRKGFK